MTRRSKVQQPDPGTLSRGAYRGYPPTCPYCGFTGIACQESSPYLACYGDPARHQRTPVATTKETR